MGNFNPSLSETHHLVDRYLDKFLKNGDITPRIYRLVCNKTWDIAEMMDRINKVNGELLFDQLCLVCIFKITEER